MNEIANQIIKITSSPEYLRYKKYHEGNIFGITKTSRKEQMHSAFISWILDSQASHGLGDFPIKQFLGSLVIAKNRSENRDARLTNEMTRIICRAISDDALMISVTKVEVPLATKKTKHNKQIDLLIEVTLKDKILPIIIENKVGSGEHNNQTAKYFKWAENRYSENKYYQPIYVYLKPRWNNSNPIQPEFIQYGYQDLVDYVLEPSLSIESNKQTKIYLRLYLQCLSYQTDNNKGGLTMAISSEERTILEQFYNQNKNLIISIFEMLIEDEDVDSNNILAVRDLLTGKDYSKYLFNDNRYGKGKLILAVIRKYNEDYKPGTIDDLKAAFPDVEKKYKNIIMTIDEGENKRHFPETIKLADGSEAFVSNQWGLGNISAFIDYVSSNYGYKITKVI